MASWQGEQAHPVVHLERICSNNIIRVKRKSSERPGQSPVWWFVIHDSEESLEVLDSKWNLVHVQTNWKLENCYRTSDSCLQNESSTPPTAMLPAPAMSPVTTSSPTTSNDVIAPDTDSADVPCNDPTTGSILSGEDSGNSEHATFLAQDWALQLVAATGLVKHLQTYMISLGFCTTIQGALFIR